MKSGKIVGDSHLCNKKEGSQEIFQRIQTRRGRVLDFLLLENEL